MPSVKTIILVTFIIVFLGAAAYIFFIKGTEIGGWKLLGLGILGGIAGLSATHTNMKK